MFRLPFPLSGDDPITLGDVVAALLTAAGVVGLMLAVDGLVALAKMAGA
jgi:hypothetical protein